MTYLMNEGTELGPYRLEQQIGRGGMAEVWKAFNTGLHRFEALKFIAVHVAHDRDLTERFLTETRVVAGMSHPNIVTIYTVSQPSESRPYYAMELLAGPSLSQYVRQKPNGRLPLEETVALLSQVAEALDYALQRGIVHRDVKPSNIMLAGMTSTGGPLVKVVDFGIAKVLQGGTHGSVYTQTGAVIGTPDYMAPEQASGRFPVSGATDQYALACVAYELLTGQPPYQRGPEETDLAVLMRHVSDPVPDPRAFLPTLPPSVTPTIQRALAKDPALRFGSCREFTVALAASLAEASRVTGGMTHVREQETVFRDGPGGAMPTTGGGQQRPTYPPPPAPPIPPLPPQTGAPNAAQQASYSAFEQTYGPQHPGGVGTDSRQTPPQQTPYGPAQNYQTPGYQTPYQQSHYDAIQQNVPLPPDYVRIPRGSHSPGVAVLLHLFLSGFSAGEFYNRQWQKGLLHLALGIAGFVGLIIEGNNIDTNNMDASNDSAAMAAIFILIGSLALYLFRFVDVLVIGQRLSEGRPIAPWDWFLTPRRRPDATLER
jgi:serine/threonine protein kinase